MQHPVTPDYYDLPKDLVDMLKNGFSGVENFHPEPWAGTPKQLGSFCDIYPWLARLPTNKNIYLSLWLGVGPIIGNAYDLPLGHDYYIVTLHNEPLNIEWLKQQIERTGGLYYVLMPRKNYDLDIPGVTFYPYYEWDMDCAKVLRWFPNVKTKDIVHKYSAICNRITQNKLWITTKLLETAKEDSYIVLGNWLDEDNVHNWEHTGIPSLDHLTDTFRQKYQGTTIKDIYTDFTVNRQRFNSNPWQPAYINTALHFNNGGFHYSLMQNEDGTKFTHPGPEICEKTIKCLLSATPFINCNQFDTYNTLEEFGMQFDYGFDLSWDNDPGNLTRFEKIINLIDELNDNHSADQLYRNSKECCEYNQHHILSGGLHRICRSQREKTVEILLDDLSKS